MFKRHHLLSETFNGHLAKLVRQGKPSAQCDIRRLLLPPANSRTTDVSSRSLQKQPVASDFPLMLSNLDAFQSIQSSSALTLDLRWILVFRVSRQDLRHEVLGGHGLAPLLPLTPLHLWQRETLALEFSGSEQTNEGSGLLNAIQRQYRGVGDLDTEAHLAARIGADR